MPKSSGSATVATGRGPGLLGLVPYVWWIVAGAALSLSFSDVMAGTSPFVVLGGAMVVIGGFVSRLRPGFTMALAGLSLGPWLLAWRNRDGLVRVCDDIGGCVPTPSPWPFVVIAMIAVLGGLALTVWSHRRTRPPRSGTERSSER